MVSLYVDTSAALRAVLETGTSPSLERELAEAPALITSRLSLVESARAILRQRQMRQHSDRVLSRAEQSLVQLWDRCDIWELNSSICEAAARLAPTKNLRTLDALHVATYFAARMRIGTLKMLTADVRMEQALE